MQRSLFAYTASFFTLLYLIPRSFLRTYLTFCTLFNPTDPSLSHMEVLIIWAEVIKVFCDNNYSTLSLISWEFESFSSYFSYKIYKDSGEALNLQIVRLTRSVLTLNLKATSLCGSKSIRTAIIMSTLSLRERSLSFLFLYFPEAGVFWRSIASSSLFFRAITFVFYVESFIPLRERGIWSDSFSCSLNPLNLNSSLARLLICYHRDVSSSPSWTSLLSLRYQFYIRSSLCWD